MQGVVRIVWPPCLEEVECEEPGEVSHGGGGGGGQGAVPQYQRTLSSQLGCQKFHTLGALHLQRSS
jgi:hypothetical protein